MSVDWRLRGTMLVLALLIALRPGLGSAEETQAAPGSELQVLLVVDETVSMSALDHAGVRSRLEGVREDLAEITGALPNSHFAVLTFGRTAQLQLPFTSDPAAVGAAVDAMAREPLLEGTGSTMDRPLPLMRAVLARAQEQHPDRRRIVVFAADGENTAVGVRQKSFAPLEDLVDGGAVFGYGTRKGGLMPTGGEPPWTFVRDLSTGQDAVSRIDEANLERIADQLGVEYAHRTSSGGLEGWARGLAGGDDDPQGDGEAKHELYWLLALLLVALVTVELRGGLVGLREARRAVGR